MVHFIRSIHNVILVTKEKILQISVLKIPMPRKHNDFRFKSEIHEKVTS